MCLCFYSSFTENLRTAEEKQNNLEFLQLFKLGGGGGESSMQNL